MNVKSVILYNLPSFIYLKKCNLFISTLYNSFQKDIFHVFQAFDVSHRYPATKKNSRKTTAPTRMQNTMLKTWIHGLFRIPSKTQRKIRLTEHTVSHNTVLPHWNITWSHRKSDEYTYSCIQWNKYLFLYLHKFKNYDSRTLFLLTVWILSLLPMTRGTVSI